MMTTAERIRNLRLAKRATQQELGNSIKMTQSVVNRIERGTRPIRDDELKALARYFGVSTDYLLGNDAPATRDQNLQMYERLPDADRAAVNRMIAALFAQAHA